MAASGNGPIRDIESLRASSVCPYDVVAVIVTCGFRGRQNRVFYLAKARGAR